MPGQQHSQNEAQTLSEVHGCSRRRFIQKGLAATAAAAIAPSWLSPNSARAQDLSAADQAPPSTPDSRILVLIQLAGGNDGLNTVVPYGERDYYQARPRIAIAQRHVIKLLESDSIGLHPEFSKLKDMIDQGMAGIVQGVGYPSPNRSHQASTRVWHTGYPPSEDPGDGLGWIGRALDTLTASRQLLGGLMCIGIAHSSPLLAVGAMNRPLVIDHPQVCRWAGSDLNPALASGYDLLMRPAVVNTNPLAPLSNQEAFVTQAASDMQFISNRVRDAALRNSQTPFPAGRLAENLRSIAGLIREGLPTRVYFTQMDGFDTHTQQGEPHSENLWHFANAIRAFYNELEQMNRADQVLTLVFSEFGRRVQQNASDGTDHGTAGPVFLFGPMVRPGLIGDHPSLSQLFETDLIPTTDFRSVYAAILDQWMEIDSATVLGKAFKPVNILKSMLR